MENEQNHWWSVQYTRISKYCLSYSFLVHIVVFLFVAIIQLRFGVVSHGRCTIDDRLVLFLTVFGVIQIICSIDGILLITLALLHNRYPCLVYPFFVALLIDGVFLGLLLTCFFFGNYVVFHIRLQVQSINSYNIHTYCDHRLYQISFWTLVTYYIFIFLFLMFLFVRNIHSCIGHLQRFKTNREEVASGQVKDLSPPENHRLGVKV